MGWRQEIEEALNGRHARLGATVEWIIMGLILASVLALGVETLPGLPGWAFALLAGFEIFIVVFFTVEYILRLVVAENRWRYATSFFGVIDLMAIAPFYLAMVASGFGIEVVAVRALRLLRVFRLFKLTRYVIAIDRLVDAWRTVREEAIVYAVTSVIALYLCALGVYFFEHEAQPDKFHSVLDAMWWAAVTLSTVGYGDIYPITPMGRLITVLMLFVALGIIAVPTGLIASALTHLRSGRRGARRLAEPIGAIPAIDEPVDEDTQEGGEGESGPGTPKRE